MVIFRFRTANIGLIMLAIFSVCPGTLDYPGTPTASAADMLDSKKRKLHPIPDSRITGTAQ